MIPRFIRAVVIATVVGGPLYLLYNFRVWDRDWSHIDEGWASLIGSATGAFLAVVGALYVSKAQDRRNKKAFENFVQEVLQNLVVQSAYLEAMTREPHRMAPTPEIQCSIISIQQRTLLDALAVFDREISASKDGSYVLRSGIVGLDSMLAETRHLFIFDADPSISLKQWHTVAYQVRWHISNFLGLVRWKIPSPTPNQIAKRADAVIYAWKKWNVHPEQIHPVSRTAHNGNNATSPDQVHA